MSLLTMDSYFKYVGLFLLFFLFLYDKEMAMIYLVLMLVDYFWYVSDTYQSFPLNRKGDDLFDSLTLAVIGYAVFLVLNTSIKVLCFHESFSMMDGVSAMAALPILAGSTLITWVGWALVIPIIETSFFHGRLFEGAIDISRRVKAIPDASLSKFTLGTAVAAAIVSGVFAVFHSKITLAPLLTIFIFSMISCFLVIRERKLTAAIFLHVIANGAALASRFNWL